MPGRASVALPQAQRVAALFAKEPVAVVGLHTVFEHHDVMGPAAIRRCSCTNTGRGSQSPLMTGATRRPTTSHDAARRHARHTHRDPDRLGGDSPDVFGAHDDLQLGRDLGSTNHPGRTAQKLEPSSMDARPATGQGAATPLARQGDQ